jgi:predicted transposase/invertase (TIGR01784 family)
MNIFFFPEKDMSLKPNLNFPSVDCELISPSCDWTFKQIFSDPMLLKNFLMSVLDWDYAPIEHIEFLDKDVLKNALTDKDSRLDLKVITQDKTILNVEIQTTATPEYMERSIYYWAKIYEEQLTEAQPYNRLYPVICVNILTQNHTKLIHKSFYNQYSIRNNDDSGHTISDRLSIHFIELPKFEELWVENSDRNNWLTFMKDPKEVMMHTNHNPHIEKAVQKLEWLSQDPDQRAVYEARQKTLRDRLSEMDYALSQGLEKGREEGREEGREQGREEQKIQTAKAFMKKSVSLDVIADALGVSLTWLEALKSDNPS